MKPGERWNQAKFDEMNQRYQDQTLEHLRKLAKQDKPFFLQYWPVIPLLMAGSVKYLARSTSLGSRRKPWWSSWAITTNLPLIRFKWRSRS